MNSKIAGMLDAIANDLESKGLVKEAKAIDVVSNTVDKSSFDMPSDPLIVKIKAGASIKADTLVLVNQLKKDIGQALSYIGKGTNFIYTSKYEKATEKTNDFIEKYKSELKKLGTNLMAPGNISNGIKVDKWKAGNSYDLSNIYSLSREMINNTKGSAGSNDGIKARDLLDDIADTYEKS